jgi:hypothetical protein
MWNICSAGATEKRQKKEGLKVRIKAERGSSSTINHPSIPDENIPSPPFPASRLGGPADRRGFFLCAEHGFALEDRTQWPT